MLNVRRNQFDISTTLSYGLNVSLVHFSLFIMVTTIVKWPDVDRAKELDGLNHNFEVIHIGESFIDHHFESITCEDQAKSTHLWLEKEIAIHFVCFFICIYREIFETVLGWKGELARFVEVICIGSYFIAMAEGLKTITLFLYWRHKK